MTENPMPLIHRLGEEFPRDIKIITRDNDTLACDAYIVSMDVLFPLVRSFIAGMMTPNNDGNPEAQQMSKLMKTAVKGILIMYGEKLLTIMLGKDHEKPPKGADLVEWYTNTFASVSLTMASQRVYLLSQSKGNNDTTEINGLATIPLSKGQ